MHYNSKIYACWPREIRWTYRKILQYLKPKTGERILEIGCARGRMTQRIQRFTSDTWGIDINEEAISRAVTKNLLVMSAERLEFESQSFDKVYSTHTIEHVSNIASVFSEMERVIKPGGIILLIYPAEPIRGAFGMLGALAIFGTVLRARDIHLHKVTPAKIRKWIQDLNLEHVESNFYLLPTPEFLTILRKPLA